MRKKKTKGSISGIKKRGGMGGEEEEDYIPTGELPCLWLCVVQREDVRCTTAQRFQGSSLHPPHISCPLQLFTAPVPPPWQEDWGNSCYRVPILTEFHRNTGTTTYKITISRQTNFYFFWTLFCIRTRSKWKRSKQYLCNLYYSCCRLSLTIKHNRSTSSAGAGFSSLHCRGNS